MTVMRPHSHSCPGKRLPKAPSGEALRICRKTRTETVPEGYRRPRSGNNFMLPNATGRPLRLCSPPTAHPNH